MPEPFLLDLGSDCFVALDAIASVEFLFRGQLRARVFLKAPRVELGRPPVWMLLAEGRPAQVIREQVSLLTLRGISVRDPLELEARDAA